MWRVFGITQRAKPPEIDDPTGAKLDVLMTQVRQLVKQSTPQNITSYPIMPGGGYPFSREEGYVPAPNYDSSFDSSSHSYISASVPTKFNAFIEQAIAVAQTESPSLAVVGHDSAEDAVILSSGGLRLSDESIRKIDHLAGSLNVRFRLLLTPR